MSFFKRLKSTKSKRKSKDDQEKQNLLEDPAAAVVNKLAIEQKGGAPKIHGQKCAKKPRGTKLSPVLCKVREGIDPPTPCPLFDVPDKNYYSDSLRERHDQYQWVPTTLSSDREAIGQSFQSKKGYPQDMLCAIGDVPRAQEVFVTMREAYCGAEKKVLVPQVQMVYKGKRCCMDKVFLLYLYPGFMDNGIISADRLKYGVFYKDHFFKLERSIQFVIKIEKSNMLLETRSSETRLICEVELMDAMKDRVNLTVQDEDGIIIYKQVRGPVFQGNIFHFEQSGMRNSSRGHRGPLAMKVKIKATTFTMEDYRAIRDAIV